MYQFKGLTDTIAAISTPAGQGGIGIVRLSGSLAMEIADKIFRTKRGKPSGFQTFTVHYGNVVEPDGSANPAVIDEVLLTVMRAPKSYTTEDVVEISCHGGMVAQKKILTAMIDCGARLAEPGEFTKRAFLNGRIDLLQAEAVLDVIRAKTDTFLRLSTNQLKGELSTQLETFRAELMDIFIMIEAAVNFPEDQTDQNAEHLKEQIIYVRNGIEKLLASAEQGRILKEGVKVVICGRPNVGKSSLLNILLKEPRAIVSDIAGTTRDTIEETTQIQDIPFQLVDTAGILEPRDMIEEEAIRRSHMHIDSADLILFMLDAGEPLMPQDLELMKKLQGREVVVVLNKTDLPVKIDENQVAALMSGATILRISSTKKIGIDQLSNVMINEVWRGATVEPQSLLISNVRHIHALSEARQSLDHAQGALMQNISIEFVSDDIKRAINALDSITGRNIDADLIDVIFEQFCIGK